MLPAGSYQGNANQNRGQGAPKLSMDKHPQPPASGNDVGLELSYTAIGQAKRHQHLGTTVGQFLIKLSACIS